MNTTEYTTFMVPNSDELQQLSELYKASLIATLTQDQAYFYSLTHSLVSFPVIRHILTQS